MREQFQFFRLAEDEQSRQVDVGDIAAAFRFVHVVRGHEQRYATAGQFKQQVPQMPPCDRVDSGCGFIEE